MDFNDDGLSDIFSEDFDNGDALPILSLNQAATAIANGVIVKAGSGLDAVVASYPGDGNHFASTSTSVALTGLTLTVSPTSIFFPETAVGSVSPYKKITLTNTSSATVSIESITVTKTSSFYSWGIRLQTCGATLAAGDSCTFDVVFRPTNVEPLPITAAITIKDDAYASPQQVLLTGEAVAAPVPPIGISPASLTFGSVSVGQPSGYQEITVRNSAIPLLTFQSIQITSTNDPYAWGIRNDGCLPSVQIYSQCVFAIVFRPTHVGLSTAQVELIDNGTGSPQHVTLTGTGK